MPARRPPASQTSLPAMPELVLDGKRISIRAHRIPHAEILRSLQDARTGSHDLIAIFRDSVLPVKTRTIQLLGRKGPACIMETLLGFEVQASYKRIQCPDMVTARYLKLFTELGCRSVRLPYDPTVTAALLPQLETSVAELEAGVRRLFAGNRKLQGYVLREVFRIIRARLRALRPAPEPAPQDPLEKD